jgi:hypothetical protein
MVSPVSGSDMQTSLELGSYGEYNPQPVKQLAEPDFKHPANHNSGYVSFEDSLFTAAPGIAAAFCE